MNKYELDINSRLANLHAAGGKGGGGGFDEDPNTLQSNNIVRLLYLVSKGPISGWAVPDAPARCILINDVPIMNEDGTYNIASGGFTYDIRTGDANQAPMPGFPNVERLDTGSFGSGLPVKKGDGTTANQAQSPVVQTDSVDVDAVRLTISMKEGLAEQKTDGGSRLMGSSVTIAIDVRQAEQVINGVAVPAGIWNTVAANYTKTGKTMSEYEFDIVVDKPAGITGLMDVRVRRVTDDSTSSLLRNSTTWAGMTNIEYKQLSYPGDAVIGLALSAQAVGNTLPKISFRLNGRYVRVPSNYDPINRTYTGIWDYSFKYALTSNPVWIWLDIALAMSDASQKEGTWSGNFTDGTPFHLGPDQIVGLGGWEVIGVYNSVGCTIHVEDQGVTITPTAGTGSFNWAARTVNSMIGLEHFDLMSLYRHSVYCDQQVNNFEGGTEPRYTFTTQFNEQEDSIKVLAHVASSMRANFCETNGRLTLLPDTPVSETAGIVTEDNVSADGFTISSIPAAQQFTFAQITYTKRADHWKQHPAVYQASAVDFQMTDEEYQSYGFARTTEVAFGASTYGQAYRHARWLVYTSLVTTRVATWKSTYLQAHYRVGEVVELFSNQFANSQNSGLIKSGSVSTLVFDRPVDISTNARIRIVANDGQSIIEKVIVGSPSTRNTVTLDTPLTEAPVQGRAFYIISDGEPAAMKFRIMSITRNGHEFQFNASQYDENKYSFMEGGPVKPPEQFVDLGGQTVSAVTDVTVTEQQLYDDVLGAHANLILGWKKPTSNNATRYEVRWRKDNGDFAVARLTTTSMTIENATIGEYEFYVNAYNALNTPSPTTRKVYDFGYSTANNLYPPLDLSLQEPQGGEGSLFRSNQIMLQWVPDPRNDHIMGQTVGGYLMKVHRFNKTGDDTEIETLTFGRYDTKYIYTYDENLRNGGPDRDLVFHIYTLDAFNMPSDNACIARFYNPAPPAPQITVTAGLNAIQVKLKLPYEDNDWLGWKVYASKEGPDFTPSDSVDPTVNNRIYRGSMDFCSFYGGNGETWWVKACGYDTFSEDLDTLIMGSAEPVTTFKQLLTNEYDFPALDIHAEVVEDHTTVDGTATGTPLHPNGLVTNRLVWSDFTVMKTKGYDSGTSQWAVAGGSYQWTAGEVWVFWNEDTSGVLQFTTNQYDAVWPNGRVIGVYRGGRDFAYNDGKVIIDGANIIAQSITATNLTTGTLLTRSAQIDNGIIINAHIGVAAIDYANINVATISDLEALSAKMGTLYAGTLIMGNTSINNDPTEYAIRNKQKASFGDLQRGFLLSHTDNADGLLNPSTFFELYGSSQNYLKFSAPASGNGSLQIKAYGANGKGFEVDSTTGSATFSGTLAATDGTFSGTVHSGRMEASVLATSQIEMGTGGTKFYDIAYGPSLPMNSQAIAWARYPNVSTYNGTNWFQLTYPTLMFGTANTGVPVNQRVRSGDNLVFTAQFSGDVDDYLSMWYRINGGAWQFIMQVHQNASDIGAVSATGVVEAFMGNGYTLEFGLMAAALVYDGSGNPYYTAYNTGKPNINGYIFVNCVNF